MRKYYKYICKQCKKTFLSIADNRVYCSRKCKHNAQKVPLGKKSYNWKERVSGVCKTCENTIIIEPTNYTQKFCSQKCMGIWQRGRKHPPRDKNTIIRGDKHYNWKGGKSFEPYAPNFNQQLKDKVRVRDNFTCQICGVPELECRARLSVHHIDYNKNNCYLDNLIALCRKCHVKTNYNRPKWIKYFMSRFETKTE